MRATRTLSLYVMRETLVHCGLAFFVLTLVLLTQNLLRRLDELLLVGMTAADLRAVLVCVLPVVISYALPLAFLVGILLCVRRLGSDGELLGLRASGVGPTAFLMPQLVLGLFVSGLSAWLLIAVEHDSRRELVRIFKTVAARGAILEPGKFRPIGTRLVYVEDRERTGQLRGVMIVDQGPGARPYRVFADRGRFRFDDARSEILLDLSHGSIHLEPTPSAPTHYDRIRFERFSYRVDVGPILGADFGPVRPKQMDLEELRAVLARAEGGDPLHDLDQRDPLAYALELHRRRALPLAPLLFAGVGVPLALASEHRRGSLGLLICLVVALGYYALGSLAESMATTGWVGVGLASWLPNFLFAGLGLTMTLLEQRRISA